MSRDDKVNDYDVIIIGAGLYGIQAARYYLEIHRDAKLCILESDHVVGGTWSSKRIYDAFWTQTPIGMAEFSDQPMTSPPPEDQYYGFFPAKYVTEYLESYVDNHIYKGQTLRDRIKFNVHVEKVEKINRQWLVSWPENRIRTSKLIDSSGMASLPHIPHLHGQEEFQGKILHHKDFGQLGDLRKISASHFVVIGGGKSAADVAYAAAKAGKVVSWIIREGGGGPAAFLSAEGRGPYANSNESFYTRFVASFLPNPFSEMSYLSRFLHKTWIGSWMVGRVWSAIDRDHRRKVDYRRRDGGDNNFHRLEPDTPLFWQNDSSGINQRLDFYSTIAKHVHVYRQDIDRLSAHSISLARNADGDSDCSFTADVIVLCTGWSPISTFFSQNLAARLGLPVKSGPADELEKPGEKELGEEEDISERFLSLRPPPAYRRTKPWHTPFRLYKAMVPAIDVDNRSIVFLGKIVVGNNFRVAEIQALWAIAYLDGRLRLDGASVHQDIDNTVSWCRTRYLNKGQLGSWFFFDVVDYTDMLLKQIDLRSHRQMGWLREVFSPCKARDLIGLLAEYRALNPPL